MEHLTLNEKIMLQKMHVKNLLKKLANKQDKRIEAELKEEVKILKQLERGK
ncbi:MAG: hypothetical protein FD143_3280 [Ignavibacteria bacterium]|nr:MAG: hypothetical protein FD143_3280 [Ignavibacteria bacterium]KAF0153670.1 MAG: hypothetical protein FD188_3373 [Ignavibacteria bacterium]